MRLPKAPWLFFPVLSTIVTVFIFAQSSDESVRSWPPDTTAYFRSLVAEDQGRLYDETEGFVRDVVVSNTDPNLAITDTFNDGETSIAVDPENPNQIVISAFSGFWGATAPIWHTVDGGNTWTKEFAVPIPPGVPSAIGCPCDQTFDYGHNGRLSSTFLSVSPTDVYTATTFHPAVVPSWMWFLIGGVTQRTNLTGVANADQPWLLTNRDPSAHRDNIYVGYDNFSGAPDMRVSVANLTDAAPPDFMTDRLTGFSTGFVNPGHRLAINQKNGYIYSLFQRRIAAGAGGSQNIDYMLNRSTDGGNTWSLNGSATGIVVANGDSTQPTPKFGTVNALLGGVLHAATDPNHGDVVYYVFGNRDPVTGNNRLSLRRLENDGSGNLSVVLTSFVTGQVQAALPSVALAENGTVGVFYYTFDGFAHGFPLFSAHLAQSQDGGAAFSDEVLETFLSSAADNGNARQRVLGDYVQMKAVGNTFYGAFTGNGAPFGRPVSNHDPIFFKVGAY
jgi:hypothetical protein